MKNKKKFGFLLILATAFSFSANFTNAQTYILFTKILQRGVKDDQVRSLQEFLKKSPDIYPEGLVTGYFGALTEGAVKLFQRKEGIDPMGIVGPITRAKLNELISKGITSSFGATRATSPSQSFSTQVSSFKSPVGSGFPVRLKIPKINVDASFEYVGLTALGAMAVPKGPSNVAWFDLGPRPGDDGSAVVAGHEGWKDGIPAVFDNLYKLQEGDKIYVENERGETIIFIVRELKTYGENDDASGVFSSDDGKAHLNLITCEGVWNSIRRSYSNRIVVFTDREI